MWLWHWYYILGFGFGVGVRSHVAIGHTHARKQQRTTQRPGLCCIPSLEIVVTEIDTGTVLALATGLLEALALAWAWGWAWALALTFRGACVHTHRRITVNPERDFYPADPSHSKSHCHQCQTDTKQYFTEREIDSRHFHHHPRAITGIYQYSTNAF